MLTQAGRRENINIPSSPGANWRRSLPEFPAEINTQDFLVGFIILLEVRKTISRAPKMPVNHLLVPGK